VSFEQSFERGEVRSISHLMMYSLSLHYKRKREKYEGMYSSPTRLLEW